MGKFKPAAVGVTQGAQLGVHRGTRKPGSERALASSAKRHGQNFEGVPLGRAPAGFSIADPNGRMLVTQSKANGRPTHHAAAATLQAPDHDRQRPAAGSLITHMMAHDPALAAVASRHGAAHSVAANAVANGVAHAAGHALPDTNSLEAVAARQGVSVEFLQEAEKRFGVPAHTMEQLASSQGVRIEDVVGTHVLMTPEGAIIAESVVRAAEGYYAEPVVTGVTLEGAVVVPPEDFAATSIVSVDNSEGSGDAVEDLADGHVGALIGHAGALDLAGLDPKKLPHVYQPGSAARAVDAGRLVQNLGLVSGVGAVVDPDVDLMGYLIAPFSPAPIGKRYPKLKELKLGQPSSGAATVPAEHAEAARRFVENGRVKMATAAENKIIAELGALVDIELVHASDKEAFLTLLQSDAAKPGLAILGLTAEKMTADLYPLGLEQRSAVSQLFVDLRSGKMAIPDFAARYEEAVAEEELRVDAADLSGGTDGGEDRDRRQESAEADA